MASNCKTIRAEIEEAAGGGWLSRAAETHVGACANCLEFMNGREKLRRLVGGLERVEAPGDFEFRLRARMAAAREAQRPRFFLFRPAAGLASLALAATLAASAYYVNRTAPAADQPSSQQPSVAQTTPPATTQETDEVTKIQDKATAVVPPPVVVVKAAGVRPLKQERRRAPVQSRVAAEPRGDVAKDVAKEVAKAREEGALEFGLKSSPVIKGRNVKVEVSSEPLSVVLRDGRGTPRRLDMNPVSFGAQSPVGKRRKPAPLAVADKEGVW